MAVNETGSEDNGFSIKDESKVEIQDKQDKQKKQEKELSVEELTDMLKRTQANFENYRKQTLASLEDNKKIAARGIILQLLPVIDNFELALKAAAKEDDGKEFLQGIKLIHAQLMQLLQDNHVLPLETVGKIFDPYYHEALMKVPSEDPENTILEEFQKGFTLHGQVLRHAKVKVSAGPNKGDNGPKGDNDLQNDENKSGGI